MVEKAVEGVAGDTAASIQSGNIGDIVILVYVGNTLLDELVVGADKT